jgi:alginate O-acetyltransferase complex protein AlgJ
MRIHPIAERLLILVFVAVIALPGLAMTLGVNRGDAGGENRTLAPFPTVSWTWESVAAFPDGFTAYFDDSFAFRSTLVEGQAAVRLKLLNVSPSPAVVRGRDGWLFYAEDGAMDDYATAQPLTHTELELWRTALQGMHDWLRERGVAYVFVISPDKHQIYPELMPATIRGTAHGRIDQLVDYLSARSTVPVLDLRPVLRDAKTRERVYHRTDTHWNDRGAHLAYQAIMSALSRSIPALAPRDRSRFQPRDVRRPGLDLAGMLGMTRILTEDDLTLVPLDPRTARIVEPQNPGTRGLEPRLVTERAQAGGLKAVVFRDSFAAALIPFVSEHFSRVVYLWQYHVEPSVIVEEKPDVVIQEMVGRRLSTILPYNPLTDNEAINSTSAARPAAPGAAATPDTPRRSTAVPPTP